MPVVKEWQHRPLEEVYAVVFLDSIYYHVRSEGQIVKKAVYIAIGIKKILGMWVGENESVKYWLSILNSLKNRGVEDILIACVDGLTGFDNAIKAVYPKTEIQQVYHSPNPQYTRFVSYKDIKALMADLKRFYAAVDEETALYELEAFGEKWNGKYPKIAQSWEANWPKLSTYFKYPQEVRTLIYTTNAIEGFNRQLRKVIKSKSVFPTDDSLLKMLYLAMMHITKNGRGNSGIGALSISEIRENTTSIFLIFDQKLKKHICLLYSISVSITPTNSNDWGNRRNSFIYGLRRNCMIVIRQSFLLQLLNPFNGPIHKTLKQKFCRVNPA